MNLRVRYVVTALVAVAVGFLAVRGGGSTAMSPLAAGSALNGPRVALNDHPKPVSSVTSNVSVKSRSSSSESRSTVEESKDKYALVKALLPRAQAGDAKAQYLLFLAYWDCLRPDVAHRYKEYPTWEVMRQRAVESVSTQKDMDSLETEYRECAGFFQNDIRSFGTPWDWLQRATDAGYAPAQAETAAQRLQQDQWKVYKSAGASPGYTADLPPIGGDVSPRELLTLAVQSGDPEILDQIGGLQQMLNPTQSHEVNLVNDIAWRYVGCQRMGGCPVEWGPMTSTNCSPNTSNCIAVPNAWLIWVNGNWAPVQDRVNQINSALEAQQWDQLGLGSGPG